MIVMMIMMMMMMMMMMSRLDRNDGNMLWQSVGGRLTVDCDDSSQEKRQQQQPRARNSITMCLAAPQLWVRLSRSKAQRCAKWPPLSSDSVYAFLRDRNTQWLHHHHHQHHLFAWISFFICIRLKLLNWENGNRQNDASHRHCSLPTTSMQ